MAKFTKALRKEIVEEFASRHDGQWLPAEFVEEVRQHGENHPAYEWFEWDSDKAAHAYQVWQAREFANGIRVSYKMEEVGGRGSFKVKEREMPLVLSPVDGRSGGGGYYCLDPENPEHMQELCRQAARDLRGWLSRYGAAVEYAGGSVKALEHQLSVLESHAAEQEEAA